MGNVKGDIHGPHRNLRLSSRRPIRRTDHPGSCFRVRSDPLLVDRVHRLCGRRWPTQRGRRIPRRLYHPGPGDRRHLPHCGPQQASTLGYVPRYARWPSPSGPWLGRKKSSSRHGHTCVGAQCGRRRLLPPIRGPRRYQPPLRAGYRRIRGRPALVDRNHRLCRHGWRCERRVRAWPFPRRASRRHYRNLPNRAPPQRGVARLTLGVPPYLPAA